MPTILITGANRGMGLEFARQYAAMGWRVLGTVRDPMAGRALSEAGGEVYVCDVADPAQVARLKASLAGVGIDIVLNNAGIYGENQSFGAVDPAGFMKVVAVDSLAPLKLAEAFADQLTGRKIIAAVSSKMGAMSDNTSGGSYAYRAAKATLNMVIKNLAIDLGPRGILTVALSPGWVRTDMGGPSAPLEAATAVAGMVKVMAELTEGDSGAFIHYDGSHLAW
ncbi:3-oxoacyl- acyl-carrier protein reductase [Paramagnetospirillum magnetotacticum MS-1]|uniref:3-oxoacyl-acyl-carrier protein reductase n=1 Tax=Paramagnetospirillum magnetotacticum MS-1 TaxID=272627 RepID=A0A0C2YAK9_PARME|nr:SDR family oxidoreductase [Paramagnetospirillum magnetotacticum]KIL96784.1 3-oxoacyl- acyl-carrier protein reductase [Paramagnetospirillum magnetotacticum MS-1]